MPALIGLDWGSTSLRAWLMGPDGQVLDETTGPGVLELSGSVLEFEASFARLTGPWLGRWPGLPALACGMVGSAQGWVDAGYVDCPAAPDQLARSMVWAGPPREGSPQGSLRIVPGVRQTAGSGAADLMRGEETQVLGIWHQHPGWSGRSQIVLPGTHSKWVQVDQGRITGLRTHMTGELYAVLRRHSILGRLMPPLEGVSPPPPEPQPQQPELSTPAAAVVSDADDRASEAFSSGVRAAAAGGADLLHRMFSARTLGLCRGWDGNALADYLSGLLIGSELQAERERPSSGLPRQTGLAGEPQLCARYAMAMGLLAMPISAQWPNPAAAGLWALSQAA